MRTPLSHAMFVVIALSSSAIAQNTLDPAKSSNPTPQQLMAPNPETYGTSSETAIAVPDWEFNPSQSATTFAWFNGRYITSATGVLVAGLHLPEGALITRMEVQGCDSNATKSLSVSLEYRPNNGSLGVTLAQLTTNANTGCTLFPVTLSTPHTVNNAINSYFIAADTGGATDASITILAVRVFYKLQVSPDPAGATFADVPHGHPFHRFVEALVAAGITGGCGGGNYCPDAPVTRGQMAVFLAGALGLHWAP
jgi:S-layer family protein